MMEWRETNLIFESDNKWKLTSFFFIPLKLLIMFPRGHMTTQTHASSSHFLCYGSCAIKKTM